MHQQFDEIYVVRIESYLITGKMDVTKTVISDDSFYCNSNLINNRTNSNYSPQFEIKYNLIWLLLAEFYSVQEYHYLALKRETLPLLKPLYHANHLTQWQFYLQICHKVQISTPFTPEFYRRRKKHFWVLFTFVSSVWIIFIRCIF